MKRKILVLICCFCLIFTYSPYYGYADSDIVGPKINSISSSIISNNQIKITINATDDKSGVNNITIVYQKPMTGDWLTCYNNGIITLDEYAQVGLYKVLFITLSDKAGNVSDYSTGYCGTYMDLSEICFYYDGTSITMVKEAYGHQWNKGVITKEPTCTNSGIKTYTCTICNEIKTENINAIGHKYNLKTLSGKVKYGIANEEYIIYTCSQCGKSYKFEGIYWENVSKIVIKTYQRFKHKLNISVQKYIYDVPQPVLDKNGYLLSDNDGNPRIINNTKTHYQIKYSTKSNMKNAKIKTQTSNKFTLTKLKSNTTYYIKVRNYYIDPNGKKHYAAWSKIKKIKTKM